MNVAIMQPYFFPYYGYFQLVGAVDKFIFYDDVAYIKQGWINRNQILLNGQAFMFSVPLNKQSSFVKIKDTFINRDLYLTWKDKFLKTLTVAYHKAPHFFAVFPVIESTLNVPINTISELNIISIKRIFQYLGVFTNIIETTSVFKNEELKAQNRIIDILRQEKADTYINMPGGRQLYNSKEFSDHGIELKFIEPGILSYSQYKKPFTTNLSFIDVLMFNDRDEVKEILKAYTLDK